MKVIESSNEYICRFLDTKIKKYNIFEVMYFEQSFIVKTNYDNYFEITLPKVKLDSARIEMQPSNETEFINNPAIQKYLNHFYLVSHFSSKIGQLVFDFYQNNNGILCEIKPIKGKRLERLKEKYEKSKEGEE